MANLQVTDTLGIDTNTFTGALFKIGSATQKSSDQGIVVARSLTTGSGNAHGIDDNTVFSRSGSSYASFDAKAQLSGDLGHYAGFEEDATFISGTIPIYYSYISAPNIIDAIVDSRYGVYIYNPSITGTGTLTNNYGIYVNDLTAGGTLNYAIWTNGTTPVRFGGAATVVGTLTVGGAAANPEVRVGNTTDGIGLRGISGEGRINGYDTGAVGFNPIAVYTKATAGLYQDVNNNVGISTKTFGTSAVNVFSVATGTSPSTGVADTVQFYSSDNSAGNTIPSFYCEGTEVIATGQADTTSSVRVKMRVNGTVATFLCV
jgi:hypothetical protein